MASYSSYHNANFQSFVRQVYHPAVKGENDEIRSKAQLSWNHEARRRAKSATVYAGDFGRKQLDETSQPRMRPSSPTRMNKPHPLEGFLVTRIHNLPGYYYNCEKRTLSAETGLREMPPIKSKGIQTRTLNRRQPTKDPGKYFIALCPHHMGVENVKEKKVQIFWDSSSNLAAQAWLKLASDKDCNAVEKMMSFAAENKDTNEDKTDRRNHVYQAFTQIVKPEFITSAHQWLRVAGAEETAAVERLLRTLSTSPRLQTLKDEPGPSHSYGQGKAIHKPEYLIHPDWRMKH
ncbi:hypothetical protein FKM82_001274 [Ascaphus truei]